MYQLQVSGMRCGNCVSAITRAITRLDAMAQVKIDLASESVTIRSQLPLAQICTLINDLGFDVISQAEV